MGKYSNISATNLKSQVDKALNELGHQTLENVKSGIKSSTILNSSASNVLENALSSISNSTNIVGSMTVLKNNLNSLKTASEYIENYQKLEKEIEELEKRRYKEESYKEWCSEHQKYHSRSRTVEDKAVVAKINKKTKEKNDCEAKIDKLLS